MDRLLKLAFDARAEALADADSAVSDASKLTANSKDVRNYKPADRPRKPASDATESGTGSEKVEEARRLLTYTVEE